MEPEPVWQDGAGSLLVLAAAHETGLITTVQTALPTAAPTTHLGRMGQATLRALLLTLLFLPVVGMRRTWDLRSDSGDALALLTGRGWAYGYRHVERFLAGLAHAGAAADLTDALARWTTQLWHPTPTESTAPAYHYIDGHRTPVYADDRIPRGLIGRTGVIEGCRALVLLHDSQGHPLLATTHRGDPHLTIGLPQILARYAAATGDRRIGHVVVDREGMGGDFLSGLVTAGCTVVTLLRADPYDGIASFTEVGVFVPLVRDRHGKVVREVAPADVRCPSPVVPVKPCPCGSRSSATCAVRFPIPPPRTPATTRMTPTGSRHVGAGWQDWCPMHSTGRSGPGSPRRCRPHRPRPRSFRL